MREREGRPLFLIDLAVPRDVDPAVNELDGCYLYDIDDLEAVVEASLAGRRREAERAEAIVAEEAERFRAWQASLDVVPTIASLRARAEAIRSAELSKAKLSDARARGRRVDHVADREQAPAPADGADEGGGRGGRWRSSMLTRCGTCSDSRTSDERGRARA